MPMGHLKVNRCLADKAMDVIDHALDRPLDPHAETYRNYYAAPAGLAAEFARSPHWEVGSPMPGGLFPCVVTDDGRAALVDHLSAIGDRHRGYAISFGGHTTNIVGISASKARYSYFLDIRDCCPDLTFKDFCQRSKIKRIDRATRDAK